MLQPYAEPPLWAMAEGYAAWTWSAGFAPTAGTLEEVAMAYRNVPSAARRWLYPCLNDAQAHALALSRLSIAALA